MEFPPIKNLKRLLCDAVHTKDYCAWMGCKDCVLSASNPTELELVARIDVPPIITFEEEEEE